MRKSILLFLVTICCEYVSVRSQFLLDHFVGGVQDNLNNFFGSRQGSTQYRGWKAGGSEDSSPHDHRESGRLFGHHIWEHRHDQGFHLENHLPFLPFSRPTEATIEGKGEFFTEATRASSKPEEVIQNVQPIFKPNGFSEIDHTENPQSSSVTVTVQYERESGSKRTEETVDPVRAKDETREYSTSSAPEHSDGSTGTPEHATVPTDGGRQLIRVPSKCRTNINGKCRPSW